MLEKKWQSKKLWLGIILYIFSIFVLYFAKVDYLEWAKFGHYIAGLYFISNVLSKAAADLKAGTPFEDKLLSRKFIIGVILLIVHAACLFLKNVDGEQIAQFAQFFDQVKIIFAIYIFGNVGDKFLPIIEKKILAY